MLERRRPTEVDLLAILHTLPKDFHTHIGPINPTFFELAQISMGIIERSKNSVEKIAEILKTIRADTLEIPADQSSALFMPSREDSVRNPDIWPALMKVIEPKKTTVAGEEKLTYFVPLAPEEERKAIDELAVVMDEEPNITDFAIVLEKLSIKIALPKEETEMKIY